MNKSTWVVPTISEIPLLTHDQLTEHLRLAKVNADHYKHILQELERDLNARSSTQNYRCMKCSHNAFEVNQIRATRSLLSSFFGVESAQYKAIICKRCKFTEFYEGTVPLEQQALDAVFGQ